MTWAMVVMICTSAAQCEPRYAVPFPTMQACATAAKNITLAQCVPVVRGAK